jgi:hypothetical protein
MKSNSKCRNSVKLWREGRRRRSTARDAYGPLVVTRRRKSRRPRSRSLFHTGVV